jgi:hypothetical protein
MIASASTTIDGRKLLISVTRVQCSEISTTNRPIAMYTDGITMAATRKPASAAS